MKLYILYYLKPVFIIMSAIMDISSAIMTISLITAVFTSEILWSQYKRNKENKTLKVIDSLALNVAIWSCGCFMIVSLCMLIILFACPGLD